MLVRDWGAGWLAITQPAHAWVSGQLARAWGNDRFARPEPWEEVCLGAEQHDAGMAQSDLAPTLNPRTGRATAFTEMPRETHVALWSAAPDRVLAQSRYAALLVSLHGTSLYEAYPPRPEHAALVDAYRERERDRQEALRRSLGADPDAVDRNRRLVFAWDWLSLALCLGWPAADSPPVPARDGETRLRLDPAGGDRATLDPWPFAARSVQLRTEGRRVAGEPADDASLRAALAAAPWLTLEWELVPRSRD
jgi:hypothetical protein